MVWTPPFSTGIEMPKWRFRPTTSERERHHEDYDDWDRFGKDVVSSAWRRQAAESWAKKAAQTQGRNELLRESRALPDRDGSLWERALLGEEALGAGPYGASDGAAVCEAVREDEQERPQRRRGDLCSGWAAEQA